MWVLCADDGRVLQFRMDTGPVERQNNHPDLETTGNIVIHFMDRLAGCGHKLYIDNWYHSASLAVHLKRKGIGVIGTVREDRLKGCKVLSSDNDLKKRANQDGRGIMELAIAKEKDIEIRVVKWFDNRSVRVLTNMASVNPIGTVQRWDKKQKKYIEVPIPDMITQYNQHMEGVNLLDKLIALYRIHLRSRKWYHRILFNFLDLALVNDFKAIGGGQGSKNDVWLFFKF